MQMELISSKGYPAEAHTVITEDGYVLVMHRIPGPRGTLQQDKSEWCVSVFRLERECVCVCVSVIMCGGCVKGLHVYNGVLCALLKYTCM